MRPSMTDVCRAAMVLRAAALEDVDLNDPDGLVAADSPTLVRQLLLLREAREALRILELAVSLTLDEFGADGSIVPGVGAVSIKRSMTRTRWHHDALIDDVVSVLTRVHDRPVDALRAAFALASPRWRLGKADASEPGIRALGLDPDDYSVAEWGPPVVRVLS